MDKVIIVYNGIEILVDKSIADYFELERKREQAEEKSDSRHLSDKDIVRNDFNGFISDKPVDFVELIANASEVEYLRQMLGSLTSTQQRRMQMYFFDGLTYEQIAKLEGADVANIWRSIDGAVKKLKKYF